MLSILDAYRDTMPPTRTYALREFIFVPVDPRYPEADGRLGNLTLKLQFRTGPRHNYAYCLDSYAIERDTPEPGDDGGQAFWFFNLTDPDAEQPYRCVVGGLRPPRCNCKAGICRVPGEPEITDGCKHRDGIQALLAAGLI